MARSYGQRRYARLRRQGLCGTCGKAKSKSATCARCNERRKLTATLENAGSTRCGVCYELGHTRRKCTKATPVRSPLHASGNEGYRQNRANQLCDRCGRPSATSNCEECSKARKLAPSRAPAYLAVKRAQQDRTAEYARRNKRRRAEARAAGRRKYARRAA